jgi:hypothetical protein
MRRTASVITLLLLFSSALILAQEGQPRYRIGLCYGAGNLFNDKRPHFSFNQDYGATIGIASGRYMLSASYFSQRNYSDSTISGDWTFFSRKSRAEMQFRSARIGLDLEAHLRQTGLIRPTAGLGAGYFIWKLVDPATGKVLSAVKKNGTPTDFKADELYLSPSLGLEVYPARHWCVGIKSSLDYMTGIGTSFSDSINTIRGRTVLRAAITLSYLFGGGKKFELEPTAWKSTEVWPQKTAVPRPAPSEQDADGDGVIDRLDKCPNTPLGAIVDQNGCPSDEDGDGVLDGLDDCPHTPKEAAGHIDIFGCPIDSDFDGVPDYLDTCSGPVGAVVDSTGCPLDSDGDGVPDGLDDCPNTPPGVPVDVRGCIDVGFLKEPMRIYIDYKPGSFEVDERTKVRLQPLVKKLLLLNDVKFTITSYTDNVGTPEANLSLSQKRANRLRDWLVSQGIATERMTPIGKGEANFVASNETAAGRAQNRRIELVFTR